MRLNILQNEYVLIDIYAPRRINRSFCGEKPTIIKHRFVNRFTKIGSCMKKYKSYDVIIDL
jgi:hypothetical protein